MRLGRENLTAICRLHIVRSLHRGTIEKCDLAAELIGKPTSGVKLERHENFLLLRSDDVFDNLEIVPDDYKPPPIPPVWRDWDGYGA